MAMEKRHARRRPLGDGRVRIGSEIRLQMRKLLSLSLISAKWWQRGGSVRGLLILGFLYCSLGGAANWYNWSQGKASLYFPILLTLGAVAILVAVPKKWDLITLSVAGLFVLSGLGTVLHRGPLHLGLELMAATGILLLICEYIKFKLRKMDGTQHASEKRG